MKKTKAFGKKPFQGSLETMKVFYEDAKKLDFKI